jgi:hypothetical protein
MIGSQGVAMDHQHATSNLDQRLASAQEKPYTDPVCGMDVAADPKKRLSTQD